MGREIKRVSLDFDWPLEKVWEGFLNPFYSAEQCEACEGSGYSPEARRLKDLWYGYLPFKPEDRGSVPFVSTDEPVLALALRNITHAPEYYGRDSEAIDREAMRLCDLFNGMWCHHLNEDDVEALLAAGSLHDLTHTFDPVNRWVPKNPPVVPTPREVNLWSLGGMGHDSINQWVCAKASCKKRGISTICLECDGEGHHWPSAEARQKYEDWQPEEPPAGDGYQIWETVSEGSPISPVFATPEELASYMAGRQWGADRGTPYKIWLSFIKGPGWAPTLMTQGNTLRSGVDVVGEEACRKTGSGQD